MNTDHTKDGNRRRIEEMSHSEAAVDLLGQVVRYERDRANRNDDRYDPSVKLASAQIHAILAVAEAVRGAAVNIDYATQQLSRIREWVDAS